MQLHPCMAGTIGQDSNAIMRMAALRGVERAIHA